MAKKTKASSFQAMGADPKAAAELESFGFDSDGVAELSVARGFSWLALLAFARKHGPLAAEFVVAVRGGWQGVLAFAAAHASEFPALLTDILAIFGGSLVPDEDGPVVEG